MVLTISRIPLSTPQPCPTHPCSSTPTHRNKFIHPTAPGAYHSREHRNCINDVWALSTDARNWELLYDGYGEDGHESEESGTAPRSRVWSTAAESLVDPGLVYLFGGYNCAALTGASMDATLSDLWVFDSGERQWSLLEVASSQPPPRRYHHSMDVIREDGHDVLLLFGGQLDSNLHLRDLWRGDVDANTGTVEWFELARPPSSLTATTRHASAVAPDGSAFYVHGGMDSASSSDALHKYVVATNRWEQLKPSSEARMDHSLIEWQGNLIAVMGGSTAAQVAIEYTDLDGRSWRTIAAGESESEAAGEGKGRAPQTLFEAGSTVVDDVVYIFGGFSNLPGSRVHIKQSDVMWAFQLGADPEGPWGAGLGPIPTARIDTAMISLASTLIMYGGGTPFVTYNPDPNTEDGPDSGASDDDDGGGGDGLSTGLLPRSDVWLWFGDQWHAAETVGWDQGDARFAHTAVHVGGGKVLVYGGQDSGARRLDDLWVFTVDTGSVGGKSVDVFTPPAVRWTRLELSRGWSSTPHGRDRHTAVVIWDSLAEEALAHSLAGDGSPRMFVFGGLREWIFGAGEAPSSEVVSFDLDQGCWTEHGGGSAYDASGSMVGTGGGAWPRPRARHACASQRLLMYCFGGLVHTSLEAEDPIAASMKADSELWVYHPPPRSDGCESAASGEWSLLPPESAGVCPHPRYDHSLLPYHSSDSPQNTGETPATFVLFGGSGKVLGQDPSSEAREVSFSDVWLARVDEAAGHVVWQQIYPAAQAPLPAGPSSHAATMMGGVAFALGGVHSTHLQALSPAAGLSGSSNALVSLDLDDCQDVCVGCATSQSKERRCLSAAYLSSMHVSLDVEWARFGAMAGSGNTALRVYDANGNSVPHVAVEQNDTRAGTPRWELSNVSQRAEEERFTIEIVLNGVAAARNLDLVNHGDVAHIQIDPPEASTLNVVVAYQHGAGVPYAAITLRWWDPEQRGFEDLLGPLTADENGTAAITLPSGAYARPNERYEVVASAPRFSAPGELEARVSMMAAELMAGATHTLTVMMPLDGSALSPPPPPAWAPGASGNGPGVALVVVTLPSIADIGLRFMLRMVEADSEDARAARSRDWDLADGHRGPAFKGPLVAERVQPNPLDALSPSAKCTSDSTDGCNEYGEIRQRFIGLRPTEHVAILHECIDDACEVLSPPIAVSDSAAIAADGMAHTVEIRTLRMYLSGRLAYPSLELGRAHGQGVGALNVSIALWDPVTELVPGDGERMPGRADGVARITTAEDGWLACQISFSDHLGGVPTVDGEPCMLWSTAEYYVEAYANVVADSLGSGWAGRQVISAVHVPVKASELADWTDSIGFPPVLPLLAQGGSSGRRCAAGPAGRSWNRDTVYCIIDAMDFCESVPPLLTSGKPTLVPQRFDQAATLYSPGRECLWAVRPDPPSMQITVRIVDSGLAPGDQVVVAAAPDCESDTCGALALDGEYGMASSRTVGVRGEVAYVILRPHMGSVPTRLGTGFQFEFVSVSNDGFFPRVDALTMLATFLLTATCCLLGSMWKRYIRPRLVRMMGGEAAVEMQALTAAAAAANGGRPARGGLDAQTRSRALKRVTYSSKGSAAVSGGADADGSDREGARTEAGEGGQLAGGADDGTVGEETGEDVCAICLVEFEDGDELVELRCNHRFHGECVDSWLRVDVVCPLCRADLREEQHADADASPTPSSGAASDSVAVDVAPAGPGPGHSDNADVADSAPPRVPRNATLSPLSGASPSRIAMPRIETDNYRSEAPAEASALSSPGSTPRALARVPLPPVRARVAPAGSTEDDPEQEPAAVHVRVDRASTSSDSTARL